jgi:hypothetical protein
MRHVSASLCCLFLLLCSFSASAQDVPTQCTGINAKAFLDGKKLGPSLVRQAWNGFAGGCAKIEEFADKVSAAFAKPNVVAPTQFTECRYLGWVQGALEQVDTFFTTCADTCFVEGEFVGALVADTYCQLSIAFGGLATADEFIRGPVEVCGLSFETACDSTYLTKTVGFPGGQCVPFTRAPFTAVYQQTQHNQCAYDPIPPDDPHP